MPRRDEDYDDDDRSRKPPPAKPGNAMAMIALVLGILSLCGGITSLPGILCGFLGLSKAKATGTGKGLALAGLLISFFGLLIGIASAIGGYYLYTYAQKKKDNVVAGNNLKQIGLGWNLVYNYTGEIRIDANTNPKSSVLPLEERLSWRVGLLPYLEQENLYSRFRTEEPWHSTTNKPLSQSVVKTFADNETPQDPMTRYRVFYGGGALFDTDRPTSLSMVLDGTSNTIFAVESGEKVPWSQCNEIPFRPGNVPPLGRPKPATFTACFVDGSVRNIRKSIRPEVLNAAITRAGGEVPTFDDFLD